ncbi:outer membrane beta-barrel protein [Roseomonas aerophila]|uniref:Outer membrane beta-barrel protein n=1 Tax=Teichococcus aerophilus TaxID=1224513 RepID=A0ABR7RJ50_9PROT|nr:outer membrane beta-barrel protein [Pseudoroseomonas aerophila]MBC9206167.1 outer membrane beta-barrel protein [Pseudoroseomonas aerophila]
MLPRCLGLAATLAVVWPSAALAQFIGPEATARGVTVLNRPRPDFDPLGVRLPGYRLDASLEGGVGYDDNLLPGQGRRRSGSFAEEALSVTGASMWTRHGIEATATQITRQHVRDSNLNWNDYAIGVAGRYDIGRASWLRLRYDHIRSHLDVDDLDVQQSGTRTPAPYDTDIVHAAGSVAFNQLRLGASLDYRWLRYQDVTVAGVRDPLSNNDHQSALGELNAEYSVLPGRALLGVVRLQDIRYDRAGQSGRDSLTWEVQGGAQYDVDGLWQARLLLGYRRRDYEQAGLKPLSGPAFEGQVVLTPSQLATVTVAIQRSIEESIRQDSVSYTRTSARAALDYEMLRNLIVTVGTRVERRDYPEDVGTVTDAIGVLEARWMLNRSMTLIGTFQHTERLSAPAGIQEYGRNQVLIRLRFAL